MIIGIDASPLTRPSYTGTEWYCYHLIQSLCNLKEFKEHRWFLYTPKMTFTYPLNLPSNVTVKKLSWPVQKGWLSLRLSFEMVQSKPDVLFMPANALPYFAPEKTFTTIHDIGFLKKPEWYSARERKKLKRSFFHAVKRSKAIITISQFSKEEIQRFTTGTTVTVTHLQRKLSETITSEKAESISLAVEKPYVLFIGRISPKKNIETLVRAWKIFKQDTKFQSHSCYIIGRAESGSKRILATIEESGYLKIKYHSWTSETEIKNILKDAAAFVFPTWYEGFGIPLLDAQHAKTPVICSDIPVNHEIAGEGALFFDPVSPHALVSQLRKLITDGVLQKNLIKKGNENLMRFSWEDTAKKTLALLLS